MSYNLCLKESYNMLSMGQINKSIASVADKCCPFALTGPVLEQVVNTGELGGRNFAEKSPLLSVLLWSPEFFLVLSSYLNSFFLLLLLLFFLRTGAVLEPWDSGLCWVCQPAKSGSPQIGEERIWVHVNGGWWVWWFFSYKGAGFVRWWCP